MPDTKQVKQGQAKADQGTAAKKQTMASIIKKKKPNTKTVDIVLDSDLANEIQLKEQEKAQLQNRRGRSLADGIGPLEAELDALYDKASEGVATFTFRDPGRRPFDDLVLEHPPTKDQKDRVTELGGGILEFNLDTFPPALMALTAWEPKMTLKQAETIFDEWGSGDAETLFAAALLVCKERTSIPLSRNGTDPTDNSS